MTTPLSSSGETRSVHPERVHETHETDEKKKREELDYDPVMFEEGIMPEVDEEPEAQAGRLEVVPDLSVVLTGQVAQGLQLNHDPVIADEVGLVGLLQGTPLVADQELPLGQEGDSSLGELDFQAFLVHSLQEPGSHLLVTCGSFFFSSVSCVSWTLSG